MGYHCDHARVELPALDGRGSGGRKVRADRCSVFFKRHIDRPRDIA